jgi:hypothetical protein
MKYSRRQWLGSACLTLGVLGTRAVEAFTSQITKTSEIFAPAEQSPVTFVDVAKEAGLTTPSVWGGVKTKKYLVEAKGAGVAFFDYDHDGWLDIYLTNGIRFEEKYAPGSAPTSHLYHNNRDGTFTDVAARSRLARTGWGTGVCVGDYDNDGWDDLFCTYYGRNVLFHNNGDGTFTDVTRKAGLYHERVRWGSGCAWLDYDLDGRLDLFVCNYAELDPARVPLPGQRPTCQWKSVAVACGPLGLTGETNILYHNNGDGTFTDVSEKAGILKPGPRYSLSPVAADFDNDGWPDLYVAVDSHGSLLFRNRRDGTFEEIGLQAGVALSDDGRQQAGMGVGVGDYDGDGWFDIFKTNFEGDACNLYHNNRDGTFTDLAYAAGVGGLCPYVNWGAGFVDYDNDGWPDVFYVTGHAYPEVDGAGIGSVYKSPRKLYRNLGSGKFEDVSAQAGPGIAARFSSRGCAFGDYDNDGDIDALVFNMNEPPSLLRNDGGNRHNWIKIKLIGTKCNRTAIGARVLVTAGGPTRMDEVRSGGSIMSQSDLRLHFGLGQNKVVDRIDVRWPTTRHSETFTGVQANQIVTIKEGAGVVKTEPARGAR